MEVGPPLDLGSQASVRAFAAAINSRPGSLDVLVNNAGISFLKKAFTDDGVGLLAQVGCWGADDAVGVLAQVAGGWEGGAAMLLQFGGGVGWRGVERGGWVGVEQQRCRRRYAPARAERCSLCVQPLCAASVCSLCVLLYHCAFDMGAHRVVASARCARCHALQGSAVAASPLLLPCLQVNHLGPYTLTRLLEPKLVASKARVVTVASVTHRWAAGVVTR